MMDFSESQAYTQKEFPRPFFFKASTDAHAVSTPAEDNCGCFHGTEYCNQSEVLLKNLHIMCLHNSRNVEGGLSCRLNSPKTICSGTWGWFTLSYRWICPLPLVNPENVAAMTCNQYTVPVSPGTPYIKESK